MTTVTHRTVYTYYTKSGRCTIQHSTSGSHNSERGREKSNRRHESIVMSAKPKRAGNWELVASGASGGDPDRQGYEPTYFAKWVKVS